MSNVDSHVRSHVLEKSGFQLGSLPIRYLGLPLITTKLSFRDCEPLMLKIRSRIDCWVNKFLNHAGRLQLLKVVLFGIQAYWTSHLFLPKFALKKLQSLFVKFLWSGSFNATKQVKVSWHDCCLPKSEGGLGLRDLCDWNRANFLFHLWRILQPDNSSLWITWFKRIYLKRKAFWTMEISGKTPWCVRKILQARPLALRFIRYQLGATSNFSFWNDPWLDNKPLLTRFDDTIISEAASTKEDVVADFIHNATWNLPTSNHTLIMELREMVLPVTIHQYDAITWADNQAKFVSTSLIWNSIRLSSNTVPWTSAVWHALSIPKCAFIFWLALKNRLLTKERMVRFGLGNDSTCDFCHTDTETNAHLFSSCSFVTEILSDTSFSFTQDWNQYLSGEFLTGRQTMVWKNFSLLYLAVAVYYVWRERNERLHNAGHRRNAAVIKSLVKRMVREKVFSNTAFKKAAAKDSNLISALY